MSVGACLDANRAGWQLPEKWQNLTAPQLLATVGTHPRSLADLAISRPPVVVACMPSFSESWSPQPSAA
jgi:hypothetical protein